MFDLYEKVLHLYNLQYHIEKRDFCQYYLMKCYTENPNNLKIKQILNEKKTPHFYLPRYSNCLSSIKNLLLLALIPIGR
jgi:hypothetical protein